MSWILAAVLLAGPVTFQDQPESATPPSQPQNPAPAGSTQTPAQPQQQSDPMGGLFSLMIPLAICFFIIYFMMIRPQKRQMKEREDMLKAVRKHDEVVTTSGLIGKISRIKDQEMELVVDAKHDVRVWMLRSAIMSIRTKSDEKDEESEKKDEGAKESEGSKQG